MIQPTGLLGIGIAAASGSAAQSYADLVIADGAVGYWKLDETSGTTALDQIGTQNGTYTGGLTSVAGFVEGDNAAHLASGRYVSIPDNDAWSPATTGEITVEVWANIQTLGSYNRMIRKTAGSGTSHEFDLYINSLRFKSDVGNLTTGGSIVISASTWYHFVWTWKNGGTAYTYVNGVEAQNHAAGAQPINTTAAITMSHPSTFPLNGYIQHAAIYPTQLSAAQVLAHYNKGAGI